MYDKVMHCTVNKSSHNALDSIHPIAVHDIDSSNLYTNQTYTKNPIKIWHKFHS